MLHKVYVILNTRPSSFLRAILKCWEWPGDEANGGMQSVENGQLAGRWLT